MPSSDQRALSVVSDAAFAQINNNPSNTRSGYLYAFADFSFQIWVKTTAGGVIASTEYYPQPNTDPYPNLPSYGFWSLSILSSGKLELLTDYFLFYPNPYDSYRPSTAFPYFTYSSVIKSSDPIYGRDGQEISLLDGQWHRLDVVRKGYVWSLYVDGLIVAAQDTSSTFRDAVIPFTYEGTSDGQLISAPSLAPSRAGEIAGPLHIGGASYSHQRGSSNSTPVISRFSGDVDEARLWGDALSQSDLNLWGELVPTTTLSPSLLGRWGFDNDSNARPIDSTGYNNSSMWANGSLHLDTAAFTFAQPQQLRLSGSGSNVRFGDGAPYKFSGPFTIEAWICPDAGQAGPIISRHDGSSHGWVLYSQPDGSLALFMQAGSSSTCWLTTSPQALFDGRWHHVAAVRDEASVRLYVDGRPAAETTQNAQLPMDVSSALMYLGATACPATLQSEGLAKTPTGCFDEVRMWSRARTLTELSATMFHEADTTDPDLQAYWQFDYGDLRDSSSHHNSNYSSHGASFEDAPFDFTPSGTPYLLAQSCLLQEYLDNGSTQSHYRVCVSARDGRDGALQTTLKVWASDTVNVKNGGEQYTINESASISVQTDAQGRAILSIPISGALGEQLHCPHLFVQADFMSELEHILVSPDRELHSKLANITGDQLRSGLNGGAALLDSTFKQSDADALAGAINDVMTTTAHHGVRAGDPAQAKAASRAAKSATLANNLGAFAEGLPVQPLYLSRSVSVLSTNPATRMIRAHYIPPVADPISDSSTTSPVPVARIISSGYRQHTATSLKLGTNKSFGAVDAAYVRDFYEQGSQAQALAKSAGARSMGDLWDSFVDGALHVVEAVVSTVEEVAHSVEVMITSVEGFVHKVIETVEDAADYLKGIFLSLDIAVESVIEFCQALFHWDQYRPGYDLMMEYSAQVYCALSDGIGGVGALIDRKLADLQDDILDALDALGDALGDDPTTLQGGGATALVQPQGDVQSDYLNDTLNDSADSFVLTAANNPTTLSPSTTQGEAVAPPDGLLALLESAIEARGVLGLRITDILSAVKLMVVDTFSALESLVDIISDSLRSLLQQAWEACDRELPYIPILTPLFTDVIGITWSARSLLCMMASIGGNVAYKLVKVDASATLVTEAQVTALQQDQSIYNGIITAFQSIGLIPQQAQAKNAARSEPSVDEQLMMALSYTLSAGYSAATVVWGIAAVSADSATAITQSSATVLANSSLGSMQVFGSLFANLCAFPLIVLDSSADAMNRWSELALYAVFGTGCLLDVAGWITGLLPLNDTIATCWDVFAWGASGVLGVLALAGSGVVFGMDLGVSIGSGTITVASGFDVSLKFVQNLTGSLTLCSQSLFLVGPVSPYLRGAPAIIDGVCYSSNALINISRLVLGGTVQAVYEEIR